MTEYPDRIPYQSWINSQLSVARFWGGIVLNGKRYIIDQETNDLVVPVPRKKRKESDQKKNKKKLFISDEMNFNP
jgi:hypothetical protein